MNNILHPLARFLVALIFLLPGVGKLVGFSDTAQMMAGAGFPAPSFFLVGAIALEIVGGTLLLVGRMASFKTERRAARFRRIVSPPVVGDWLTCPF